MKVRSVLVRRSIGIALVLAFTVAGCGSGADGSENDTPSKGAALSTAHPECPNVCHAICNGEPEPELPDGCPIPSCSCE